MATKDWLDYVPKTKDDFNKDWFEAILSNANNQQITVNSFAYETGAESGDNYMSTIYAVKVECVLNGAAETYQLMVKLLPENEAFAATAKSLGLIRREIVFYSHVMPDLLEFCEKAGAKKFELPVPRCFFAKETDDAAAIVLEDLRPKGFRMADRTKGFVVHGSISLNADRSYSVVRHSLRLNQGLTPDETSQIITAISRFQSASHSMLEKGFVNIQKYRDLWGSEDPFVALAEPEKDKTGVVAKWGQMAVDSGKMVESTIKDLSNYNDVWPKLKPIFPSIYKLFKVYIAKDPGQMVLNHGDLWVNNVLLRYDQGGNPLECMLIDWQLQRYASPVLDLQYTFYTSTPGELREKHLENLLEIFSTEFIRTAKELGVDAKLSLGMSPEFMTKKFNEFRLHGFIVSCFLLPIMMASGTKQMDMESSAIEELSAAVHSEVRANEGPRSRMVDMVNELDASGTFDNLLPEITKIIDEHKKD